MSDGEVEGGDGKEEVWLEWKVMCQSRSVGQQREEDKVD